MHMLRSVAPRYDSVEDRVLLLINAGKEDEWACWLTRRMALGAMDRLNDYLDRTSLITKKTPLEYRTEVAAMERQAALARMQKSIGAVNKKQLMSAATSGELALGLRLTPQKRGFQFELTGAKGGQASGLVSRTDLQTILLLIEQEAAKAGWIAARPTGRVQDAEKEPAPASNKARAVN